MDTMYRTVSQRLTDETPVALLGDAVNYAVRSEKWPNKWYTVSVYTYDSGQLVTCTCDGFRYRDNCSHVKSVPRG